MKTSSQLLLAVCCFTMLINNTSAVDKKTNSLLIHVGGTMRPVMEKLGKEYTKKSGQKIVINSGGSGELLAQIEMKKNGDMYICHDPFMDILMQKFKMGTDAWDISELTPVIVVRKGNPKKIKGLQDLTNQNIKLYLTDPKYSTLGHLLPTIFAKAGINLDKLNKKKKIHTNRKGSFVANMVVTKNADAAICWNAVAALRKKDIDIIPIPAKELPTPYVDAITSATAKNYPLTPVRVTLCILKCSRQPQQATKFAEFVISDEGKKIFKEFGYDPARLKQVYKNGKSLSAGSQPLTIFAGAGLRRAIESLKNAFTKKTGIKVITDYAGSGILITRARGSKKVDLFMPGDVYYVDRLNELTNRIAKKTPICYFIPVIITAKGNPKKIKTLKDFLRKDIRPALGNPKACQVGRLCAKMFRKNNIDYSKIKAMQSLTVNELGVWVKTGNADAAIVWDAIADNIKKDIEIIPIPKNENIISKVVVGQLKDSPSPKAAMEFLAFIISPEGQTILKKYGYQAKLKSKRGKHVPPRL
jgi:molybdate transport system substrate-binding protein